MSRLRRATLLLCLLASPLALAQAAATAPVAAPAATAVSEADIDRLTDLLVQLMPFGKVFDSLGKADPKWPAQDRPTAVNAAELACLRGELSSAGVRRGKRKEVAIYAANRPHNVKRDIELLEGGAAALFGRLIMAGAESVDSGKPPETDSVVSSAGTAEQLSLMTLATDPQYLDLRNLAGLGDMFNQPGTEQDSQARGEKLGSNLVTVLMLKAMTTCDVPVSRFQ